jgi:Skp family chaperone for outer membrane proteins
MKRYSGVIVLLSLIACTVVYSVYAGTEDSQVLNVGYINSEYTLSNYAPTAELMQKYKDYSSEMTDLDTRAEQLLDSIRAVYIAKINAAESQEAKSQLELEFQAVAQQQLQEGGFFDELDAIQTVLYQVEADFQKQVDIIQDAIKAVAEELELDLVLEATSVVYGGRDITVEVFNYLNAMTIVTLD